MQSKILTKKKRRTAKSPENKTAEKLKSILSTRKILKNKFIRLKYIILNLVGILAASERNLLLEKQR